MCASADIRMSIFNHHFVEMGLDPEMDFKDANHVSYSGAQKFTDYMTDYLTSHYDLPDHRGEADYAFWQSESEHAKEYREKWITSLQANIDKYLEGKKIGETLPTLSSLSDWWSTAQNDQFTYVLKADRSVRDLAEDAGSTADFQPLRGRRRRGSVCRRLDRLRISVCVC